MRLLATQVDQSAGSENVSKDSSASSFATGSLGLAICLPDGLVLLLLGSRDSA
jgi:hypothetical protein